MRSTLAFGLHTDSQSSNMEPSRREAITQTSWSVHNLDTLLSSMTGRPTILRNGDVTTPLPGEIRDSTNATSTSFADTQVRLAIITQNVLSKIYTERRKPRTWTQIQQTISSLMSDLDDWALHVLPKHSEPTQSTLIHDTQRTILRNQYLRAKISITRPALRRIEQCTAFDHLDAFTLEAAETCIRTANDVAALFPEDVHLQLVYENGPWWSIVSNSKHQSFDLASSHQLTQPSNPSPLNTPHRPLLRPAFHLHTLHLHR
jgi:hypothetical protein